MALICGPYNLLCPCGWRTEVITDLKLEKASRRAGADGPAQTVTQLPGLAEWLEEMELEEYLEDVLASCLKEPLHMEALQRWPTKLATPHELASSKDTPWMDIGLEIEATLWPLRKSYMEFMSLWHMRKY